MLQLMEPKTGSVAIWYYLRRACQFEDARQELFFNGYKRGRYGIGPFMNSLHFGSSKGLQASAMRGFEPHRRSQHLWAPSIAFWGVFELGMSTMEP